MNLKFDVRNEEPIFSSNGKYSNLLSALIHTPSGSWLVVSGFDGIDELQKAQAAIRSRKSRKLILGEYKTRRIVVGETMELWIKKI